MLRSVLLLLLGARLCVGEVFVEKTWDGGMRGHIRLNVAKDIFGGWTITLKFSKQTTSINIYAADIMETRLGGQEYLLTNKDYNKNLKTDDIIALKFSISFSGEVPQGEAWLHEQQPPSTVSKPPPGRVLWKLTKWNPRNVFDGWKVGKISWGQPNMKVTADPSTSKPNNALRVFYRKNSYVKLKPPNRGGCQFRGHPFAKSTKLTLTYEVYFSKNFDFVRGGKLPGLYGGEPICSGGRRGDCFSLRYMWRRQGDGEIYIYMPHEKKDWFCKLKNVICNFEKGHSLGRGTFKFRKGSWNKIQQYVRLNDPGKANAVIKMWHNGKLAFEIRGLTLRASASLKIDSIYFSTFFGGNTPEWRSSADVYTYYKNFYVTDREPY